VASWPQRSLELELGSRLASDFASFDCGRRMRAQLEHPLKSVGWNLSRCSTPEREAGPIRTSGGRKMPRRVFPTRGNQSQRISAGGEMPKRVFPTRGKSPDGYFRRAEISPSGSPPVRNQSQRISDARKSVPVDLRRAEMGPDPFPTGGVPPRLNSARRKSEKADCRLAEVSLHPCQREANRQSAINAHASARTLRFGPVWKVADGWTRTVEPAIGQHVSGDVLVPLCLGLIA